MLKINNTDTFEVANWEVGDTIISKYGIVYMIVYNNGNYCLCSLSCSEIVGEYGTLEELVDDMIKDTDVKINLNCTITL